MFGRHRGKFVDLGMAVMARGYAIICCSGDNLVQFLLPIVEAFIFIRVLQEAPTAAAAEIVGHVGTHIKEVFFADARFEDETEILRQGVTKGFPYQVTGVLNGKLNF